MFQLRKLLPQEVKVTLLLPDSPVFHPVNLATSSSFLGTAKTPQAGLFRSAGIQLKKVLLEDPNSWGFIRTEILTPAPPIRHSKTRDVLINLTLPLQEKKTLIHSHFFGVNISNTTAFKLPQ